MNIYETDQLLAEYLLFHYGEDNDILPWPGGPADALHYPVRCVTECFDVKSLPPKARALDLGCAVGRSTFELARHCAEVIGIDYSQRFITAATQLRDQRELPYLRRDEGDLSTPSVARISADIDCHRVHFERGDALDLRADLGTFDAILMANLIDRLNDPRRLLERLPSLVNPGGQVVIASPYTWMRDFTPRENWLGGFEQDGQRRPTRDALQSTLEPHFTLLKTSNQPLLIREHVRKYQWSVAETTTWRRH
ncbi:MAG: putative 4-mercaptohistidine N1-methyltransferase [Chthoniobacter sp.]|uniref:putative 4-mercaptohistidine N1-methyltransferase n=1 Tax=Chthoniobacter sp. TaxID=2510640 RepID=UPI0032A17E56